MGEKNHNDWSQRRPVGRPKKVDWDGSPIYRVPTSIYLDIRMKEWLTKKTGNLSEWIEKMIRSAHLHEYCFWCFDDNIKIVLHGVVCCNKRHRHMAGRGAPSVVLQYRSCPNCETRFSEHNMPAEIDGDIYCGICKQEKILLEAK